MEQSDCKSVEAFSLYLKNGEKSQSTIEKYVRDVKKFFAYAGTGISLENLARSKILEYKDYLGKNYKPASANSMLIALNGYMKFAGRPDCCVRTFRTQKQIFRDAERELSREEYNRLVLEAAKQGKDQLFHILQTIGATGIRVSELSFITAESLANGMVTIQCKEKRG